MLQVVIGSRCVRDVHASHGALVGSFVLPRKVAPDRRVSVLPDMLARCTVATRVGRGNGVWQTIISSV